MRTFLQHLSRDFEKNILQIIGDYAGSWCFVDRMHFGEASRVQTRDYHRLRFFVTKRRHLGRIFVERISPRFGIMERKWLNIAHWQPSYDIKLLLQCRSLQDNLRNLSPLVNVQHLHKQIKVCRQAMSTDCILVLP